MEILANPGYYWNKTKVDLRGQYSLTELNESIEESDLDENASEEDNDEKFFQHLTSKGENILLVVVCIIQVVVLGFFWLLTRNNSYELTVITVGVAYGTDIKRVREVLVEGMQKMRTKDQYGREIVDSKYGINVVVGNMSDSSVDVNVKQYVLVAERIGYVDRAKEVIYDTLTAAGITIPFPQCDVHLIHEE